MTHGRSQTQNNELHWPGGHLKSHQIARIFVCQALHEKLPDLFSVPIALLSKRFGGNVERIDHFDIPKFLIFF
jgi:hypothetical protein